MLRGAEWGLLRTGLDSLWDWIEATFDDPRAHRTGVQVFDRLQPAQKLAMLALVGAALSDEDVATPELTALTEGAAAAVFEFIRDEVASEIDMAGELGSDEDPTHWRARILAAYVETEGEAEGAPYAGDPAEGSNPEGGEEEDGEEGDEDAEPWSLPPVDSADLDDWESMLDSLTERLFWDADYDMEVEFADADPAEAATRKRVMRIRDDYFTAIAPDPTDQQLEEIRRTLARVCNRS